MIVEARPAGDVVTVTDFEAPSKGWMRLLSAIVAGIGVGVEIVFIVTMTWPSPPDAPGAIMPLEFRDPAPPPPGAEPEVPLSEPAVTPDPPLPPPAWVVAPR